METESKKRISVISRGSEEDLHLIFITGHGSFGSEEILDEYSVSAENLLKALQEQDKKIDSMQEIIDGFNIVGEMGAYQYKEGMLYTAGSANLSGKVFGDAIKIFKNYLLEKLK